MSYSVQTIEAFEKQARKLAKKYPSLKEDLRRLINTLKENPLTGTPLGNQVYKIRLAITSKGEGKRSGARVITYAVTRKEVVCPIFHI